jgi:F-type H+-transporting ATPase subunit b
MEATLHALGEILLKAIPTFFLVLFLHFYLKSVFFKPLEKVLHARREATEGARQVAENALQTSAEKAARYDASIRNARSEVYQEQAAQQRKMQDEKSAAIREARLRTDASVAEAKGALAAEAEVLKTQLDAESDALAEQIAAAVLGRRAA